MYVAVFVLCALTVCSSVCPTCTYSMLQCLSHVYLQYVAVFVPRVLTVCSSVCPKCTYSMWQCLSHVYLQYVAVFVPVYLQYEQCLSYVYLQYVAVFVPIDGAVGGVQQERGANNCITQDIQKYGFFKEYT